MNNKRKRESVGARQINDDLMMEIIARLPTKSLRRFHCVSENWREFISEISSRRKLLLPMSGLFFYDNDQSLTGGTQTPSTPGSGKYTPISNPQHNEKAFKLESRLSSLPFYSKASVIDSCNGLLLFATCEVRRRCSYFVCNPTTMEFVTLPKRRRKHRFCFLCYDPRESPHYKVVRFNKVHMCGKSVEIYSSLSCNWVEMFFDRGYPVDRFESMFVFHKGSLNTYSTTNLVRFDFKYPDFVTLYLPSPDVNTHACMGESRGHLYYAAISPDGSNLDIWTVDLESDIKWLLKHSISTKLFDERPLTPRDPARNKPALLINPIAFHPDLEVIYLSTQSKILAYHPSSRRLEEICQVTSILNWTKVFIVAPCPESIDPPGGKFFRTLKISSSAHV